VGSLKKSSRLPSESTGGSDAGPRPIPRPARTKLLVALGLAALTLVAFAPAFENGFVNFDDETYVVKNPHVLGGFTARNVAWAFGTSYYAANWHPLTWLSLQLDATLWKTPEGGPDPRGFHGLNVALHVLNTVLLFLVFSNLTARIGPSAVLAALFAVHPLRVESVAWVAERKDVLSSLFGLLALLAYTRYAAAPSARRYLAVAILFGLSLLAKPMWVTLPFVLLLLDWWPLGRAPAVAPGTGRTVYLAGWWPLLREKLALLLLALGSCWMTWLAQQKVAASSLALVPFGSRIVNALVSFAAYLAQTFWPVGLAPFYPLPLGHADYTTLAASVVVLLAISAAAVHQTRTRPYLLVGWLWFLGTMVPVIGLVQVGGQARADRYTYLPLIGIDLMVVWGLDELAGRLRLRPAGLGLAAVAAAVLTLLCQSQTRLWRDDMGLWVHTARATGDNWMAQYSLGVTHERAGNIKEAISCYVRAMQLNATNAPLRARAGTCFHTVRDFDDARACYEEALRLDKDYAQAHANLGALLRTRGDPGGALEHLRAAVRLDPDNPESAKAYFNLGVVLRDNKGDRAGAKEAFRNALRLDPANALYQKNWNDIR
jgi:Flp pilus assembly protein TadD